MEEIIKNENNTEEEKEESLKGEVLLQNYDVSTGKITLDTTSDPEQVSDEHWNRFNNDDENVKLSPEEFSKLFGGFGIGDTNASLSDMTKMMELVQRRLNGEKFSPYKELPDTFKNFINTQIATNGGVVNSTTRNSAANVLINLACDSYKESNYDMDIDAMLNEFSSTASDLYEAMDKDYGNLIVDITDEIYVKINNAIDKAKEENNSATINKLSEMKDAVDEAFHLTKFKEFCKTVKIKKFDLEKPQKFYSDFNQKYADHVNTINDITYCAEVLSHHNSYGIKKNVALIVAFCKYCMNKKPDNFNDHTFMYYFVRNIYTLDRINHLGASYDIIAPKSKPFYDQVLGNLNECIKNIKV